MSTRAVKVLTALSIGICLILLVMWPILVGAQPPASAEAAVRRLFAVHFLYYISSIVVLLVISAVGAVVIMRRTVVEVREAQKDNMKELIETTLEAHKTKSDDVAS